MLTHKEIENLCDDFMYGAGWSRVRQALISEDIPVISCDRIYYLDEISVPLVFEIKPENALDEILKMGIGQLACCCAYKVKPYLVISESQWARMKLVLEALPWLGVITYFPMTKKQTPVFEIDRGILVDLDLSKLVPKPKKELTLQVLMTMLEERKISGFFTLKKLKKLLENPVYKISTQNLGKLLKPEFRQAFEQGNVGYFVFSRL